MDVNVHLPSHRSRLGNLRRIATASVLFLFVVSQTVAQVGALTSAQKGAFRNGIYYFNTEANDACGAAMASGSAESVSTTESQAAIAKIIIGIAKTNNLGREGALIGLMVAVAESKLTIYANANVPLSLNNPNKQAVGHDHDSLGVFQQRISTNWSTISTDKNNQAAVDQLMDPAYNAEAFFGSPSGSNAAPALSKGLQNQEGWQSMDPWDAAQKVQVSGFKDGSNYKSAMPQAQSLLNEYWDTAPAIALPVPITGGTSSTSSNTNITCAATNCSPTDGENSTLSPVRQNVVCLTQREYQLWKSGSLKPGDGYHKYSQDRDEDWCADFVSWIYNQAQYPLSSNKDGNVPAVSTIKSIGEADANFHYHAARDYTPKPGDIVVHENGESHVNIVTAVNGSTITIIGGNQGGGSSGFSTSSVTQYNVTSTTSDGITGFVSPD